MEKIDISYYEDIYGDNSPIEKLGNYGPRIRSRRSKNDSVQKSIKEQRIDIARRLKEEIKVGLGRNLDEII